MTLQGDLSTLDLADLFQNLETATKSGTLTVDGSGGRFQVQFQDGQLVLLAADGRPSLMDALVGSGAVSEEALAAARKRRRRSGKSLAEVLVAQRAIAEEELLEFARQRLLADACELVATGGDAFTFAEGGIPRGVFDPEERRLPLALPVGPLLLEAARRSDHWDMVRARIPSDSAHFLAARTPDAANVGGTPELVAALVERLDGSRSVAEVMAAFTHERFQAYEVLAAMIEGRAVRPVQPEDLLELSRRLRRDDPERARAVVNRALEAKPQHLDLLCEKAELAEQLGDSDGAVEALKLVAHLMREAGRTEEARDRLAHARELDPADTAIWARSFLLAAETEDEQAVPLGLRLAELYQAPGLHAKALEIIDRLIDLEPEEVEFQNLRARALVDCGRPEEAAAGLIRFGRASIATNEFGRARTAFEALLELDPEREEAVTFLERLENDEFRLRGERRLRWKRNGLTLALALTVTAALYFEAMARRAWAQAERLVSESRWIEDGRYLEAHRAFASVADRFPGTVTSWIDVDRRLELLELKGTEVEPEAP